MKLVLAEKPSVARDLARFLRATTKHDGYLEGNGYQVTWAYGHLVTLKEPEDYDPTLKRWLLEPLPIVPASFGLKVIDTKLARKQFRIVKSLLRSATEIICATDAGREGELIFRYILQLSGCGGKPFKRLWLNSLTDKAIRDAFHSLKDGADTDDLFAAARARSEADWVVGLNATRGYTVRFGKRGQLWSVGRVQTPVLAMIAGRDDEIRQFRPEAFWELFTEYRHTTFKHTGKRSGTRKAAEELLGQVRDRPFEITSVVTRPQKVPPPQLFDLTELQRHMNRLAGLSAAATLKIAQRLYEAKLVTYPRTDSRYLSSDMRGEVPGILDDLRGYRPDEIGELNLQQLRLTGRIVNDQKVSDHHAIIPTGKTPSQLTGNDARVFDAIVTRFIAAFYPTCEKLNTTVEGHSNRVPFRARGSQIVNPGWMRLYPGLMKSKPNKDGEEQDDQVLPQFREGESGAHAPFVKEGVTKPPSHFNDSSLLTAMETCGKAVEDEELREALKEKGLGTPATRAQIIETLIGRGYIVRQQRQLTATDAGRYLVALITSENLKSAELTGAWEGRLKQVEEGKLSHDGFMTSIVEFTRDIIDATAPARPDLSQFGPCPLCGRDVIQGKRAYGCSGWRDGCTFVLIPEYKRVQLTTTHVRELLQFHRLAELIPVIDEGGMRHVLLTLNRRGELEDIPVPAARPAADTRARGERRGRRYPARRAGRTPTPLPDSSERSLQQPDSQEELGTCPLCGQPVVPTPKAFSCSAWRNGCKFAIWKRIAGKAISERTAKSLLSQGTTPQLKGFKSKAGKPFAARLKLEQGQVKLDFS